MNTSKTDKQERDTQRELLQLQTNSEKSPDKASSTELVIREKIEGTPFQLINMDNKGWFLALGKFRMTEIGLEKEVLIKLVEDKDWTLILDTIAVLTER